MKKIILFALIMVFTIGVSTAFAADPDLKNKPDSLAVPNATENKLSEEELSHLTKRVEEIRDMDKTDMTVTERRELKKELKGIKENIKRDGGLVYIGTGTLILIIILVIILV